MYKQLDLAQSLKPTSMEYKMEGASSWDDGYPQMKRSKVKINYG